MLGLQTGSNVAVAAQLGYLPEILRAPVNLSLSASLAPLPSAPYNPPADTTQLPPAVALFIGAGATIAADPGAAITVSVTGRTAESVDIDGSQVGDIAGQNAVADIEGTVRAPSGTINVTGVSNAQIWLGTTSKLDASGVAVADLRQNAFNTGEVLAGGIVTIATQDASSTVVGAVGSTIDVSGASGVFDVQQDGANNGPHYVPTRLWSDAGSIVLSATTLLYEGTLFAQPGARLANGGSLTVSLPSNDGALVVQQAGTVIPADLKPTSDLAAVAGQAIFLADRLTGSGIANLTLAAGPASQGALSPATVQFNGNVTIAGLNSLTIDASEIGLAESPKPSGADTCNVCLSANYVALQGAGSGTPSGGTGILRVAADMIDIDAGGNAGSVLDLTGVESASFISATDIRLGLPLANLPNSTDPGVLPSGQMITAGQLTLAAQQVYPESDVDFTLKSVTPDGTIRILGSGTSASAPLSAGGQVTVDAANIIQDGTLRAPLGTIRLGVQTAADLSPNDATGEFVVTKSVTLAAGSVTSVSLDGLVVPFGQTADGKNWSYDSAFGVPLTQAPQKTIDISGGKIDLASNATVDLSGGGDIQAMEFVQGTGGTRDVLTGANVYAIIPGYNPKAAPVDFNFVTDQGDSVPAAGSAVYLSASPGLPAGFYTLLPAHYATLPGAYRVEVVAGVAGCTRRTKYRAARRHGASCRLSRQYAGRNARGADDGVRRAVVRRLAAIQRNRRNIGQRLFRFSGRKHGQCRAVAGGRRTHHRRR